jgi:Ca2+-binding EF-hand superfamily protein
MNVQPKDTPISPQMRVDKIFKQMDTNDDQKISRDEFIKGLLNDEFLRHLLAPI